MALPGVLHTAPELTCGLGPAQPISCLSGQVLVELEPHGRSQAGSATMRSRAAFLRCNAANERADDWVVPQANVVGTVQHVIPYVGYVTDWVRSRTGFAVVLVLPAAYLAIGELRSLFRNSTKAAPLATDESTAQTEQSS